MTQYENLIDKLIDLGLEEDINTGDVTTDSIIPESMNAVATMTAKQDGVISGIEVIHPEELISILNGVDGVTGTKLISIE